MKHFLSLIALLLPLTLSAQVRFSVDTTALTIGEQAELIIEQADVWPSMQQLTGNGIEAVEQWFDTLDDGRVVLHTTLTSFEPGDHWLHLTPTDSLMITVADVADLDSASFQLRDIAPTMREPYTFWEIFRWILLGLLLAAVAVAAIFFISKYRNHEPITLRPKTPPVPAHITALHDLDALRVSQLWQQGKVKEYYTRLTDIVRSYIEAALGVNSTDMTTDETLDAVASSLAAQGDAANKLRRLLQSADMVKFAKSEPLPHEHDQAMTDAFDFVSLTKQLDQTAKTNPTEQPNTSQAPEQPVEVPHTETPAK